MAKQLGDSALFNNLIVSDTLKNSLNKINVTRDGIKSSDIVSELAIIDKRLNYPSKAKTMNLFDNGILILVNNKEVNIPTYLAVMPFADAKGGRIMINLSKYSGKTNVVNSPNTLFALMQNGLVSYELFTNWEKYVNNIELMSLSSAIYSELSLKVLDKLYSTNLDKLNSDFISFVFAKFFLVYMAGKKDSDLVDGIAYKSCFNKSSFNIIKQKEELLEPELLYKDIFTLFNKLNEMDMHNIKIRSFIENFVRMYGEQTILAIDHLPLFYHTVFSVIVNGNINKEYIIENTAKTSIVKCYSSFMRLI